MVKVKVFLLVITIILLIEGCSQQVHKAPVVTITPVNSPKNTNIKNDKLLTRNSDSIPISSSQPEKNTIFESKPSLSIKEAWGDVPVKEITGLLPNGKAWGPLGISDSGDMIIIVGPGVKTDQYLMIYNINKQTYETIGKIKAPGQTAYCSINSKWVVWSEILDQTFSNFRVNAYNRHTKKTMLVYENPKDNNGIGFPGPIPNPQLNEDEFVWSSVSQQKGKVHTIETRRYNLLTNKSILIEEQATNPIWGKDFLFWIGNDNGKNSIYCNKDKTISKVTNDKNIMCYGTDGNSIIWTGHDSANPEGWTVGIIEGGQEKVIRRTPPENAVQFPSISKRIAVWQAYDVVQAYDRILDKLVTLEDKDAGYSAVGTTEKYLYWTTPAINDPKKRVEDSNKRGMVLTKVKIIKISDLPQ